MILRTNRRDGNIVLVSLIAIMLLLMLFALQVNAARTTVRKVEMQHAADAAAHAAGLEFARAMNAITACNHLIGQLNGLGALAMAFGGLELEEGRNYHLKDAGLEMAHGYAVRYGQVHGSIVGYNEVKTSKSASGAAIGRSRQRLKQVMA
ncbi:MAG: hypothetical protein K1X57_23015, partial [Gemmataceae bacterium]|nr:hypothetical protein [Gemmataceae bacterium]